MSFQKYSVRDVVFLALLAAALTVVSMITMPLVMTVTLFGVRNAASAIFYAAFCAIALMNIRKPGALVLLGIFNGLVLVTMSPVMLLNNIFAGTLTEIIILLIFKNYQNDKSILVAAGLFVPLTLPSSIIFGMLLNGRTFADVVSEPLISLGVCAIAAALSFAGAFIGLKIGKELQKAGKLKASV